MPVKTVEIEGKQYAELADDGKVLYVGSDGAEVGYDGEALAARVTELNGEAATRRREAREAKEALAKYSQIEDPEAALEALATVRNLADQQLVAAGEVEKVKAQAVEAVERKWEGRIAQEYQPIKEERDTLKVQLRQEKIGGRFARSQYISDKIAVPIDMIEKTFGHHFHVAEDGRVVAVWDPTGDLESPSNLINTPEDAGPAGFDKALEMLVDKYPGKNYILKGSGKSGTGAPGSGNNGSGGAKTMSRAEFNAMAVNDPAGLNKLVSEGLTVAGE